MQNSLTKEQKHAREEADAKLLKEVGKNDELARKQKSEIVSEMTTVTLPVTTTIRTTKVTTAHERN